jgi:hypothetical protein
MTEEQIKVLGWELVKQYEHDEYQTYIYKFGCMEIELTYEGKEVVTADVSISELKSMSLKQAEILTELIQSWA